MPPRPALMSRMPGLACASTVGVHEPDRVCGVLVAWIVTKSQIANELFDRRHELHAELAGALGAHERVVGDEPHAERVGALRDEHADAPEPDDAERLAVQLDAFPLRAVPLPALQVGVRLRHVARLREQQRERVLGGREDVRLRRVHDHHAAPRRLGDVDVVEADAGPADDDEVGARRRAPRR